MVFFENHTDSLQKLDSIYTAHFFLGENTSLVKINYSKSELNSKILNQLDVDYSESQFSISINRIPYIMNKIVSEFKKTGNPYSQVSLLNISKSEDGLIADLRIYKSKNRSVDKIIIKGYENFPSSCERNLLFIFNY